MKQILTVFVMMLSLTVFAQKRAITGKVSDDKGLPLPGVSLVIKGTKTGTITDFDGKFSITAENNDVLVFSFISMQTKSVPVGNASNLNVSMKTDTQSLDEVVVIGYGTVKKKELIGAVSTVKAEQAYIAPAADLSNGLQGRASGVQVTSSSGAPGSSATIRIRGGNSITAGNEPLFVIDGYIGAGDLSTINSNDIESIQILKDAASTSIYGARGANGVVLVTTKKGKKGKTIINFKVSKGSQYIPAQIGVQTGAEFAAWRNQQATTVVKPFDLANLPGKETNWQSELTRVAPVSDYQLSASGGSENTQYYTSFGYLNQQGVIKNTGFERFSFRNTIDTRLSKVFKTGVNIAISKTNTQNDKTNFTQLIQADPLKPVYNDDGTYTGGESYGLDNSGGINLAATNDLVLDETIKTRSLINTYIQAELGKFIIKSTVGVDLGFNRTNNFTPSILPSNIVTNQLASAQIDQNSYVGLLNENTINYNATLGKHSFGALGGITFQQNVTESTSQKGAMIPSDGVGVYNMALAPSTNISMTSSYSKNTVFSLLARATYAYDSKYLLLATFRRDASSKLSENNKFANFPSVGLGWVVSKESFLMDFSKLDLLKLKANYGLTGNSGVGINSTASTVSLAGGNSIIDGVLTKGSSQGTLAGPNVKWEITTQYDAGLELSFFKGRLSADVDVYYKKTTDLLLDAEVPYITGYTTTLQNIGSLENKGIDFSLTAVPIRTKDFEFTTTLSISKYKNKVLDLGIKSFIQTSNLGAPANDENARLIVGEPVGTFWGYVYDGVDATTGNIKYQDLSGPNGVPDGVITTADKTVIGNANPDYYGGLHLDFKYKKFDLSTFFPFSVGGQNYNSQMMFAGTNTVNSFSYLRDRMWSVDNPNDALLPRVGDSNWFKSNSLFVQDASYFRLGTLQFGYTIPNGIVKGINKCRFYFTGTNLFLFKANNYLGYDPDVSSFASNSVKRGFDNVAYPNNRSILFGIDISL